MSVAVAVPVVVVVLVAIAVAVPVAVPFVVVVPVVVALTVANYANSVVHYLVLVMRLSCVSYVVLLSCLPLLGFDKKKR